MKSAGQSLAVSGRVYLKAQVIAPWLFNDKLITVHVLRKLAHFTEFFILGVEICLLFILCGKFRLKGILVVCLIGFLDACLDETLQIFYERGASFIDVLIDFSGYLLAVFIILIIVKIVKCKKIPTK